MIKAAKLNEAGYAESILGFGMAMKPRSAELKDWWTEERFKRVEKTAIKNAGRGKGHDKFLRGIMTWWLLDLPRFFSQEHATYKVGTVTCSASTMHRITYEPVTMECFDTGNLNDKEFMALQGLIDVINDAVKNKDLLKAKRFLPESYMLEQMWVANYAVLNTVIQQRYNHRLAGWQELIEAFHTQVNHPELLVTPKPTIDLSEINWGFIGSTNEFTDLKTAIGNVCRNVTNASCINEICVSDIVETFSLHGFKVISK